MPTATQVAEWIVRYRSDDLGVPVDPMQLQKLLVYAQSFHLALTGRALFPDEVAAWRDGIVVEKVWQTYRAFGNQAIVAPEPAEGEDGDLRFDEETEAFLRDVVSFFGGYTAIKLSDAVHSEAPWLQARHGYQRRDRSNVWIRKETLAEYYRGLMADGEEAFSRQELLTTVPDPRWGQFYVAGICVRRMARHPFFNQALAERLQRPIPDAPHLPDSIYEPVTDKSYAELGDISGLTPEEIARRAAEASRAA